MSYCRFAWGGSDVYIYEGTGGLTCCGCRFDEEFDTDEPEEMIKHLGRHRRAGHFVPEHAVLGLWEDIPGAQRPATPEPLGMTKASVLLNICQLEAELKRMNKQDGGPVNTSGRKRVSKTKTTHK